jgi:hypothetical protein
LRFFAGIKFKKTELLEVKKKDAGEDILIKVSIQL